MYVPWPYPPHGNTLMNDAEHFDDVDLRSLTDRLLNPYRAPATKKAYATAFKKLVAFCAPRGWDPEDLTPDQVAQWLASMYRDARNLPSIRSARAALKARYGPRGQWTKEHGVIAYNVIANLSADAASEAAFLQRQAAPIALREYNQIVRACKRDAAAAKTAWQRRDILTDLALLSVMRDTLCRRSEAAAMRWEHIERDPDGNGSVLIPRSKTDPYGEGHVAFLSDIALNHLDAMETEQTGGVFISRHKRPMSDNTVCRRLKRAARRAGLDDSRISGHSPRVGTAHVLAGMGMGFVEIQQVGRWKTPSMPYRYVRRIEAKNNAVARMHRFLAARERQESVRYLHHETLYIDAALRPAAAG